MLYAERLVDADPDADITVVIGMGQIHDWAQGGPIPINSQSANYRDDVYRQLGIVAEDDGAAVSVQAFAFSASCSRLISSAISISWSS